MTSIALGVFIVFIVYVMIWSMRNDGAKSIRDQTGFIKMRVPDGAGAEKPDGTRADRPSNPGPGPNRRARTYGASRTVSKDKGRHDAAGNAGKSHQHGKR